MKFCTIFKKYIVDVIFSWFVILLVFSLSVSISLFPFFSPCMARFYHITAGEVIKHLICRSLFSALFAIIGLLLRLTVCHCSLNICSISCWSRIRKEKNLTVFPRSYLRTFILVFKGKYAVCPIDIHFYYTTTLFLPTI